jgi:hypothetical protein
MTLPTRFTVPRAMARGVSPATALTPAPVAASSNAPAAKRSTSPRGRGPAPSHPSSQAAVRRRLLPATKSSNVPIIR